MVKIITASRAKNNFGYLLEEVYVKGNSVTITRNNKPIAKISPVYGYENATIKPALNLSDKEYKKVKAATKAFKDSFKFTF